MGICIVKTNDYITEGLRQLNDTSTYRPISPSHIHFPKIWAQLRSILNDNKQLYLTNSKGEIVYTKDNTRKKLTEIAEYMLQLQNFPDKLRLGHFYLLMKVHKSPIVGRPIVSSIDTITYYTSKYIDFTLQPLLRTIPSYIQSSEHILTILERATFPSDCIILCADVNSLYPSIPIKEGLEYFQKSLERNIINVPRKDLSSINIKLIVKLMEWVLNNNYFKFGEYCYHQINGTAMGTPAAVVFACLFLDQLETEVFRELQQEFTRRFPIHLLYKRYIDDIFAIFPDEGLANSFLKKFASKFPSIFCSSSTITSTHGIFLDLYIYKGNQFASTSKLDTKVYQKPQNKYLYLPPNSYHSRSIFKAFIIAEINRYRLLCNNDEDFLQLKDEFFTRLLARGYNKDFLQHCFNKQKDRHRLLQKALARYSTPSNNDTNNNTGKTTPCTFIVSHTPDIKPLQLKKLLKLPDNIKYNPYLQDTYKHVFNQQDPIICYYNSPTASSFFSSGRKTLHSEKTTDKISKDKGQLQATA